MNVAVSTLHRASQPLELGDQYWSIRDAIVQAELLIMRMLKFQVTPVHPHKVGVFYFYLPFYRNSSKRINIF